MWDVGQALRLVADSTSAFDLTSTLPTGVRTGGTFSVSPSGTPLPAGVTLSPSGILTASATAQIQSIAGVVFAYDVA